MRFRGHGLALGLFAAVLAAWLVAMAVTMRHAALEPDASGMMLAIFEPGTPEDAIFAGLIRAEALVVRPTAFGFIWVVTGDTPGLAGRLARHGAIGAYRDLPISPSLAGCFALADATVANLASP